MDAREVVIPLLHDPKRLKGGDIIKMLYLEPMLLTDDVRLEIGEPTRIQEVRKMSRLSAKINTRGARVWNLTRPLTYTHIAVVSLRGTSKILDLRDAQLAE